MRCGPPLVVFAGVVSRVVWSYRLLVWSYHVGLPLCKGVVMGVDRHKFKPIRVRPRESDRLWLAEHSAATGRAVNAIVADAIAAYRAGLGGPTASGPTTVASGPTTEKQPKRARAAEVPPPAPVIADLVPASSLPRRCSHPGKRSVGGYCHECDHRILPGGEWA